MGVEEHSTLRPKVIAFATALTVAFCAGGCRRAVEEAPKLEAVDVEPALTIGTEDDQRAVERPPALVGVLPEDFPNDLPLHLPASLVDFGTSDTGWYYVNLLTPHSQARVERELSALLTARGWRATDNGSAPPGRQLRKGALRARLLIEDARPGTRYRYEYPG